MSIEELIEYLSPMTSEEAGFVSAGVYEPYIFKRNDSATAATQLSI